MNLWEILWSRVNWGHLTYGFWRIHESPIWSRSVMSDSLQPHGLQPTRVLPPWDSPGKSTGVAISFSRGSSLTRDRTRVSRIAGRRFNLWATREFLVNVFHSELQFAITCYRGPKIITHPNTCYTLLLWLDIPQQRMYLKRVQELHHFTGFPGQCWGATSVQGRFLFSRQVRY